MSPADAELLAYDDMLRVIVWQMSSRLPSHIERGDLLQAGRIALWDCLQRYDPACGATLRTFAAPRVHGAMLDELRSQDWMPRASRRFARDEERARSRLQHRLGRAPLDSETAAEMNLTIAEYREAQMLLHEAGVVHLDHHNDPNSQESARGQVPDPAPTPHERLQAKELVAAAIRALEKLTPREKAVMASLYDDEASGVEVAAQLGISTGRVAQLHHAALRRIGAASAVA